MAKSPTTTHSPYYIAQIDQKSFFEKLGYTPEEREREKKNMDSIYDLAASIRKEKQMSPKPLSVEPAKPAAEWTKQDILRVLDNPKGRTGKYRNSQIIQRMLVRMYARQTEIEQSAYSTICNNGIGFNGIDAQILSDIAVRSEQYRDLTERQAALVAKKLKKYIRQLCDIAGVQFKEPKVRKSRKPVQQELGL